MADWVNLLNLYVNYETKNKVGDLAASQTELTNAIRNEQAQKTNDNLYLSKLVDIYVQVRKCIQGEKYFDVLISGCYGISLCDNFYKSIVDAEIKLKASDLQIRLFESLPRIIKDKVRFDKLADSMASVLMEINNKLLIADEEMKSTQYHSERIDIVSDRLKAGQFIIAKDNLSITQQKDDIFEIQKFDSYDKSQIVYLATLDYEQCFYKIKNDLYILTKNGSCHTF
jgi:hypothetical protein